MERGQMFHNIQKQAGIGYADWVDGEQRVITVKEPIIETLPDARSSITEANASLDANDLDQPSINSFLEDELEEESPALRRVAGRCRPDRRCSSFAKRSRTSGRQRAKKQLGHQPDSVTTSRQTDSDAGEDRDKQRDDTHTQQTDIESTQPINERLKFPNELNHKNLEDKLKYSRSSKDNIDSLKSSRHSSSYCSNCGDYVSSISIHDTFRSLPNYTLGELDQPSIDSPDNSSGPISFDSGIEQPYKDNRTSNSSPIVSLVYCTESKSNPSKISSREDFTKPWDKSKDNALVSSTNLTINLHTKQTKTAETQTDWIPFRVLVIERDQVIPAKSIFELKHRDLNSNSSSKLLRVTRRTRDRRSWRNNSSTSSNNIEEDQDRVYHSDSAINCDDTLTMPVGTSFENSAMKSSFSLSSLQGAATGGSKGSPLRAPASQERPYHSLTKKRKDSNRELWRRSWGSTYSNQSIQSLSSAMLAAKDDFWAALQPNYNYIMDNQLIDSCREANGELDADMTPPISLTLPKDLPSSSSQWNLGQLIADFTELCQWLTNIQEEVYASPENLANRTLRAKRMAELKACDNRRRRFMEQCAGALARGGIVEQSEVAWRARHLALKWDSVLQVMSPEHANNNQIISDAEHEVKCLRRWLREMEVRLPPLSLTAAASWSRLQLDQKVKEHEVLQREVEWHGRIVSSVVRLCRLGPAEAVAKGLERRWHHLYLRALEWQCHLESCLSRKDAESLIEPSQLTDSDEEPVTKHPRLIGPNDDQEKSLLAFAKQIAGCLSADESEEENDDIVDDYYNTISPGSDADTEGSLPDDERDVIMASLPHVDEIIIEDLLANMPVLDDDSKLIPDTLPSALNIASDQIVADDLNADCVDGLDTTFETSLYDDQQTPSTVMKRPRKVNDSKFRSTNRKSKNLGVYYFKHPDTESDTQLISGTEDKSQDDTSEEEWTYTACDKENSAENTDVMTSSAEITENLTELETKHSAKMKLNFDSNSDTPEKLDVPKYTPVKVAKPLVPENIIRLVKQADEMVQKKALEMNSVPIELAKTVPKKSKLSRNLKPLNLNGNSKDIHSQSKMSRIKEWLQQNTPDDESETSQQVLDSCDASGEYTTGDSDRQSVTSEENSPSVATFCYMNSSQEHSINLGTPTNQGPPKVILRTKRINTPSTRPWSVSCLSQLNYNIKDTSTSAMNTPTNEKLDTVAAYGRSSGMSISESALNTLAGTPNIRGHRKDKFQGSTSSVKTAIQVHLSSSTTLNEGCITCNENANEKKCSMRRKRQKLRRKQEIALNELEIAKINLTQNPPAEVGNRLVKSCSFSGKSSMKDDKHDRCSSDPSSSRNKHRLDSTSPSETDSEEENTAPFQSHLGQSTDHTIQASASEDQNIEGGIDPIPDVAPKFKLGPEGGIVRPRVPFLNLDRERASLLGLTIVERSVLAELASADRDSDVDRSIQTAGTEEHSSFSEQAWDYFCQDKYQSEAYSEEAPDSDTARRLLEFGDDYRMFLDSQSDACSSLSAHPDASPHMGRRKYPMHNYSPTSTENRRNTAYRSSVDSPETGSFGKRSKKSSVSNFDRKKPLADVDNCKSGYGEESERIRRAKKILSDSLERKRLQASDLDYSSDPRKYTSTSSDMYNSSLEYQSANQLNGNRPDIIDSLNRRNRKGISENSRNSDDSVHQGDSSLNSSLESPSRRKRLSYDYSDPSRTSSSRRRGGTGTSLLQMERKGFDSDSDTDDIKHLIDSSKSQLREAEAVIAKEDITPDLLQINDYSDLLATCNENVRCLEAILAGASEGVLPSTQLRDIAGFITRWNTVRTAGETRLTARRLHREILSLKGSLLGPKHEEKPALHSRAQIHHRVEDLRARLATLNDQNTSMVKLNASVHRLLTEVKANTSGNCISDTLCNNLSGEVTDLYVLWNESFESANTELQSLESALEAWKSWEQGMAELRGALRGDCDTVRLIEAALAAGDPARVAPHVTKLATLLSEANQQKVECGSLSDSGLSDSGGEQELSERERRLAELRLSARAMEAVLAPGSKLLKGITRKMEQAELELRTLQTTCRELIVRTAVGVASAGSLQGDKLSWDSNSRLSGSSARRSSLSEKSVTSPDDPDSDPSRGISSFSGRGKRWAWCALPLQICLLAILCACLMGGPRCCDAVNNLSAGFTPQLRYTRGPPPI